MKKLWRERLEAAVEASDKSARSISTAAGCGVGYVHSILKEGKDPTIERLIAICEAVPVSPIYVLWGIDALPEDIEILKALRHSPAKRDGIIALLKDS